MKRALIGLALAAACSSAAADAVQTLRDFVREVRSGTGSFTQTVTSPDGARRKSSSGSFDFVRPGRFRFAYRKPFEQLIVADGTRVWTHDPDLDQASVRTLAGALGATPAAILAGGSLEQDFDLEAQATKDGLAWALARPKRSDGPIQSVRVGFRGTDLAAIEIVDAFGQRSQLQFSDLKTNVAIPDARFRFTPPVGTDVIEQ
jgi:outer membrane lipoprotein carrier protein